MGLESSGVYQQSFAFWSVTLQPLGAYRYTIPYMNGDIHSFNMRYNSMTCTKRLQRYSFWNFLIGPSLVESSRKNKWLHFFRLTLVSSAKIHTILLGKLAHSFMGKITF